MNAENNVKDIISGEKSVNLQTDEQCAEILLFKEMFVRLSPEEKDAIILLLRQLNDSE